MQWSFYLVLGAVHTTDAVSERKGAPRYPSRNILGFTCKLTPPRGGGGEKGLANRVIQSVGQKIRFGGECYFHFTGVFSGSISALWFSVNIFDVRKTSSPENRAGIGIIQQNKHNQPYPLGLTLSHGLM